MNVTLSISLKEKVESLLRQQMRYRDNDLILYARIISDHYQQSGVDPKQYSLYDFLCDLALDRVDHFESVRRIRQKLQEDNPELRGGLYDKRQSKTAEIKYQLGYDIIPD